MKENTFEQTEEINMAVSKKIIRVVFTGLLFAAAIVLSIAENSLQIPVLAPGVKLGLANVMVMYALFFLGKRYALLLAALKAVFALITRGGRRRNSEPVRRACLNPCDGAAAGVFRGEDVISYCEHIRRDFP